MKQLRHRIHRRIARHFPVDLGGARDTVLLAGSGRSGTTWVGDLVNYRNNFRVLFEPFHPVQSRAAAGFSYREYLRPAEASVKAATIRKVLEGRVRDPKWIDRHNHRILAHRRLVKGVRANLMLKWIRIHCPHVRIIYLLRHPCAVAISRMQMGWEANLRLFLDQPHLMADHLEPFRALLEETRDPFERQILAWCAENYVPLRQFEPGEAHVAFYERLCVDPEHQLPGLLDFAGETFNARVLQAVRRPSHVSQANSAIRSGDDLVNRWRRDVSRDQLDRAMRILGEFGLDRLYGESGMPLIAEDRALGTLPGPQMDNVS
ncbi:sulfotransferase domain-containing protein [bacterium]|nr:sulfotransferase domain-containing protein [bacterium]